MKIALLIVLFLGAFAVHGKELSYHNFKFQERSPAKGCRIIRKPKSQIQKYSLACSSRSCGISCVWACLRLNNFRTFVTHNPARSPKCWWHRTSDCTCKFYRAQQSYRKLLHVVQCIQSLCNLLPFNASNKPRFISKGRNPKGSHNGRKFMVSWKFSMLAHLLHVIRTSQVAVIVQMLWVANSVWEICKNLPILGKTLP